MRLVTTSQPQFFPPLYLLSRFNKADEVVWLTQAQYQSKQFMSGFMLMDGKRLTGVNLRLVKEGRPWVQNVRVNDPLFLDRATRTLIDCYPEAPYIDEAVSVLRFCYSPREMLDTTAMVSMRRLMDCLGLALDYCRDTTILGCRQDDPSEWLAYLTRKKGDAYFQGKTAMDAYLDKSKFEGVKLFYQNYEQNVDAKLSVLHYIATLGLEETRFLCHGDRTTLVEYV